MLQLLHLAVLALCAFQDIAVASPIKNLPTVAHELPQLPISPPMPNDALSTPSTTPPQHDKRYYYPETLPDEDELEAVLKEQSLREAGFVSAPAQSAQFSLKQKQKQTQTQTQSQKLHNSPDAEPPIPEPMHPSPQTSPKSAGRAIITYRWEKVPDLWPPFSFFFIASALVCMFTILRGVRSKT